MNFLDLISLLSKIVYHLSFISTFVGFIYICWSLWLKKDWKTIALLVVFPFYIIKHILSMPETYEKKLLSILVLGAFFISIFFLIIEIILTPPI